MTIVFAWGQIIHFQQYQITLIILSIKRVASEPINLLNSRVMGRFSEKKYIVIKPWYRNLVR